METRDDNKSVGRHLEEQPIRKLAQPGPADAGHTFRDAHRAGRDAGHLVIDLVPKLAAQSVYFPIIPGLRGD